MSAQEPTAVSVVAQIDRFLMKTGVPFSGDVQVLAEQMTRYLADNLSSQFTEQHAGAGLYVAVGVKRGDESGGYEYREGSYVKPDGATS